MGLPVIPLPTTTVDVEGEKVEVRGLSRSEAMRLGSFRDDPDAAEDFVLACGVDVPVEEVHAWRDSTPPDAVDVVLSAILELSGLTEGAQKSDGPGRGVG